MQWASKAGGLAVSVGVGMEISASAETIAVLGAGQREG